MIRKNSVDDNSDLLSYTINILNQKYGLDIKIDIVQDSKILPHIKKRIMSINYNIRLATLFALYNFGNAELIIKYYLTHKFLSYNLYDEAENWLRQTISKSNKILIKSKVNSTSFFHKNIYRYNINKDEILKFQQLFVLLHEYSHGLFYQKEDIRNYYFDIIKNSLNELESAKNDKEGVLSAISKELHWGSRSFLMEVIGYGFVNRNLDLIPSIYNDIRKIEEFACDLHAWNVLISILHYGGFSLKEQIVMFTKAIEALYYLENYKAVDDCLSYKIDMNKAENISLFDSIRYSILTYKTVLYLEGKEKGKGFAFDKQFSLFRWNERYEFIKVITKYLPLSAQLKEGAKITINKEQSISIYEKINNFEESFLIKSGFKC